MSDWVIVQSGYFLNLATGSEILLSTHPVDYEGGLLEKGVMYVNANSGDTRLTLYDGEGSECERYMEKLAVHLGAKEISG